MYTYYEITYYTITLNMFLTINWCINIIKYHIVLIREYTAISIKVVLKKRKRSNMSAKGFSASLVLFPNTLPFIGFPLSLN